MKSDMMNYKGYRASIGYDKEDGIFVGEVFGLSDSLNFHGSSTDELEKAFHDSIDSYIKICEEIGKAPEKEFSGSFNVRISPSVHKEAAIYAAENGFSLNQVVSQAMETYLASRT